MKYLKTYESSLTTDEKEELLSNVCFYLEDIMPKCEGFGECLWAASDWVDDDIKNDAYFTFDFDTMYFEDEISENFDEFLRDNNLDSDVKERYYDRQGKYGFNKRMVGITIKLPINRIIEIGELYKNTNKFNL